MIRKNVANQTVYLPQLRLTADGSAVTTGASLVVAKDGVEAAAAGTLAHYAGGIWKYTPTQGETDCAIMALVLTATGADTVLLNILTTAANPQDATAFGIGNLDAAMSTRLAPTVSGRTLDVTATGAAGIDWGNIENQSAMVDLGNTNIQLCSDVDNVGFVNVLNAGAITASSIAANALDNKGNWNIGKTGYALTQAFPANFASLGINVSGHISRVTLVDTTTTNTDMRGTDNAALASNWTATRAGYLDGVLLAANFAQRTVQVTGSNHVAADIHELQPYVITDLDFDATGLAAIAGRVADEPLATHTTAGTLGKVLSDAGSGVTTLLGRITSSVATMFSDLITMITGSGVSPKWSANALSLAPTGGGGGGTGTGARTVTITTQLSGAPLEGASVRLTKGAETYVGQTNVSGQLTFNVDDGTWVVSITSPGATFGGASLVVDGPETMTYSLTAISLSPSAPGGVTGYWLCLGVNGLIESGVTMSMQAVEVPEGSTGLALDTTIRTATSNGSGVAQFTDLVPGARYSAWRGTGSKRYITIPEDASGSLELNSLLGSP